MVNNVARAIWRAGTADARYADRAEAIDEHTRLSGFVVETDPAFDEFLVALQDSGAHPRGRTRRMEEKDARKTHRQFHARAAILDGRRTGGEGLQRAVEEHRMHRVFTGAGGDDPGQRHAARRVTRARGEFANRSEFFPVAQPQIAHIAIEGFHFDRLGAGCRRAFPSRRGEDRFRAFAAHRADDM